MYLGYLFNKKNLCILGLRPLSFIVSLYNVLGGLALLSSFPNSLLSIYNRTMLCFTSPLTI